MKHALRLTIALLALAPALIAGPQFRNAGATLVAEASVNGAIESGEDVTVRLALKNIGDQTTSNLVATLQTGNGVSSPATPSRNYGVLKPCGLSVARDFSFKCTAPSNSLLVVTLVLEDSGQSFGSVEFRFHVGPQVTYASSPVSVIINSFGPAATFPSVLSVSNAAGRLVNVSVTLSNLSHAYPDDLDIVLVSPSGDSVMLMSDTCGGEPLEHVTLVFTDDAQGPLPDDGLPNPQTVRPTNFLIPDLLPLPAPAGPHASVMSAFNGKEANGDWQLFIFDDFDGDEGALYDGWSLTLTTLEPVDGAPTLVLLGGEPNQTIRFAVSGRAGHPYVIETSPDPVQFVHLESFEMPSTGTQIFEYELGPTNRFFRAATDPK